MHTLPDIYRLRSTLDQYRSLDSTIVRNLREFIVRSTSDAELLQPVYLVDMVSRIVKQGFRPCFHSLGLA